MLRSKSDKSADSRRDQSGFTLIEVLIVLVILGILAGVVVASVSGITNTGGNTACTTDTKTIVAAEETYYATPQPPNGFGSGGGSALVAPYAGMNATNYQGTVPPITPAQMGPLVPHFLQSVSTLHYVIATAPGVVPAAYTVYVANPQCGTTGALGAAATVVGPANPNNR